MSRVCYYTGKKPVIGRRITRRGIAKKKGGIGLKTTGITTRRFQPNLQNVKIIENGTVKHVRVSASYLKTGRVKRAPKRTWSAKGGSASGGNKSEAVSANPPAEAQAT